MIAIPPIASQACQAVAEGADNQRIHAQRKHDRQVRKVEQRDALQRWMSPVEAEPEPAQTQAGHLQDHLRGGACQPAQSHDHDAGGWPRQQEGEDFDARCQRRLPSHRRRQRQRDQHDAAVKDDAGEGWQGE